MTITAGTAPYTYAIVGTLPAGLTLNTSTGAVSGTPTASGSFSVQVTDSLGATSTGCANTINPPLSVTCASVSVGCGGTFFGARGEPREAERREVVRLVRGKPLRGPSCALEQLEKRETALGAAIQLPVDPYEVERLERLAGVISVLEQPQELREI
ncbi:MAG: Ig domain-containing protein [Solirubrobacteraceae bacterium]